VPALAICVARKSQLTAADGTILDRLIVSTLQDSARCFATAKTLGFRDLMRSCRMDAEPSLVHRAGNGRPAD
jgi:hypothetical protein